jgi:hypothetical protein
VLEFARERLGWWSDPGTADMPYPIRDWRALADPVLIKADNDVPVFAVDMNPIRTRTAIAACGTRADGLDYIDLVQYASGSFWVVDRLRELQDKYGARVVMAGDSAAASLLGDLDLGGVVVETLSTRELTQACGSMYDAIQDKSFRHLGQEPLDDAVSMARRRQLEGAWALARKGGDIAPLVAALIARHVHALDAGEPTIAFL